MKINVITLFPETVKSLTEYSIVKRALDGQVFELQIYDLRQFGLGKRRQVDDTPYGGGAGMVLRVDVVESAIKKAREDNPRTRVIALSPRGRRYDQPKAREYSQHESITLLCGHYEGFDERIYNYVDEEVSIGDYILSGGEIAAAAVIDSVVRLIPGAVGNEESIEKESFEDGLLEYPHFTKPRKYDGKEVPEVLFSGNHAEIEKWRWEKAVEITKEKRPDLLA